MTDKTKNKKTGQASTQSGAQASAVKKGKRNAAATAAKTATRGRRSNTPSAATRTTKQAAKSAQAKNAEKAKAGKPKKPKLVRDSFTMPKPEYEVIDAIKARCLRAGVSAKKSQILRAAVTNLARLSDASLARLIQNLAVIKTGRPKKSQ